MGELEEDIVLAAVAWYRELERLQHYTAEDRASDHLSIRSDKWAFEVTLASAVERHLGLDKWLPPWSTEQIEALNKYQRGSGQHPYTCRTDSKHPLLVPSERGWHCVACDYTQDWAYAHTHLLDQKFCPDCGVKPGKAHREGCDVARCTGTGEQRIAAHALREQTHFHCMPDIWTGRRPGLAECEEFGWFAILDGPNGWLECDPDYPGAVHDLNRLVKEGIWDPKSKRWNKPK